MGWRLVGWAVVCLAPRPPALARPPARPCLPAHQPPFNRCPFFSDKSHTCERSRNQYGSLSGADRSTARDAEFWDEADLNARMAFSLRCAYAHGTAAVRTHLINMTPRQAPEGWGRGQGGWGWG